MGASDVKEAVVLSGNGDSSVYDACVLEVVESIGVVVEPPRRFLPMWPSLLCGCLKHWCGAVAGGLDGQTLRWPTRGMSCQRLRSVVAFCVFLPLCFRLLDLLVVDLRVDFGLGGRGGGAGVVGASVF